jgi:hypothetical protein
MNKPQTLFALVITACIVIPVVYTFCGLGKASAGDTNNLTDAQHRATKLQHNPYVQKSG